MWRFASNSGLNPTSVVLNNVAEGHRWIALIFRINDCFSIFILSLSHDLVRGKPINVVLMYVVELLNVATPCLLKQRSRDALVVAVGNAAPRRLEMRLEFQTSPGSVTDVM